MKRIIILLLSILLFASCEPKYNNQAVIKYRIHYSTGYYAEKEYIFKCGDNPVYSLKCYEGSNILRIYRDGTWPYWGEEHLESTSAPIEIISFIKR